MGISHGVWLLLVGLPLNLAAPAVSLPAIPMAVPPAGVPGSVRVPRR
ncbi:MAG TPA: hypothetical protein VGI05_23315 [Streptosporangiaceae bacterium]|jgi:hypothetical protein